ncbi:uncharacterized protein [Branchiostoma lanceolatum]|uniref:uncharacterized protein n=1 Tax=Branchiostoma lanceolatum TaxID=7740 RepID=UPI0034551C17
MANPATVFQKHDVNKDGKMSAKELEPALKELGVTFSPILIKAMMTLYDFAPYDGFLGWKEFHNVVGDMDAIKKAGQEAMIDLFKTYDKDGSGFISREELKEGMAKLGIENSDVAVDAIIKESDVNKDGKISFREFATVIGQGKPV